MRVFIQMIADLWSTVIKPMAEVLLTAAALATLCVTITSCAQNWSYSVKSMHHDQGAGRHYVVCKSGFTETFLEVEVTPEVYNLVKVGDTCPAPMSIPPSTAATTVTPSSGAPR